MPYLFAATLEVHVLNAGRGELLESIQTLCLDQLGRGEVKSCHIGILILERESGRQVGLIEFHPSRMLEFHSSQPRWHVHALKPVEKILNKAVFKEPLYTKYAGPLKRKSTLGTAVLKQEARRGADAINRSKRLLRGKSIRARMVEYHDGEAVPTK